MKRKWEGKYFDSRLCSTERSKAIFDLELCNISQSKKFPGNVKVEESFPYKFDNEPMCFQVAVVEEQEQSVRLGYSSDHIS